MVGMDGKYKFTWRTAACIIICIISMVALMLLLRAADGDMVDYELPSPKAKTEKTNPDIQLGSDDEPQEAAEEVSDREQNKRQSYEQMRHVISSPNIE